MPSVGLFTDEENRKRVNDMFQGALGRPASEADYGALSGATNLGDVQQSILQSPEHRRRLETNIGSAYDTAHLARNPADISGYADRVINQALGINSLERNTKTPLEEVVNQIWQRGASDRANLAPPNPNDPRVATSLTGDQQGQLNDFLRRNPGDSGRAYSALGFTGQPTSGGDASGGGGTSGGGGLNFSGSASPYPGGQFSDPYTSLFEDVARRNLSSLQGQDPQFQQYMDFLNKQFGALQQPTAGETAAQQYLSKLNAPNPQLDQLMGYINKQFENLSANPNGYTPDELALLRTQVQAPIMAQRDAAQQRVLERAGQRGILPSSGLVQSEAADTDRAFAAQSAAAQRDLAINAMNRAAGQRGEALSLAQAGLAIPQQQQRQGLDVANLLSTMQDARRQQALGLAGQGFQIPDARLAQALGVANQLYQLPRTALADALAVVSGSAPQQTLSPFVSLQGEQLRAQQYAQEVQQQQRYAYGQIFAQLIAAIPWK